MSYISSRRSGVSPAFRGVARGYPALAQRRQVRAVLNAPIRYSMYYLAATFVIFMFGPLANDDIICRVLYWLFDLYEFTCTGIRWVEIEDL